MYKPIANFLINHFQAAFRNQSEVFICKFNSKYTQLLICVLIHWFFMLNNFIGFLSNKQIYLTFLNKQKHKKDWIFAIKSLKWMSNINILICTSNVLLKVFLHYFSFFYILIGYHAYIFISGRNRNIFLLLILKDFVDKLKIRQIMLIMMVVTYNFKSYRVSKCENKIKWQIYLEASFNNQNNF